MLLKPSVLTSKRYKAHRKQKGNNRKQSETKWKQKGNNQEQSETKGFVSQRETIRNKRVCFPKGNYKAAFKTFGFNKQYATRSFYA